jgi:hypothetical protein
MTSDTAIQLHDLGKNLRRLPKGGFDHFGS